MNKKWLYIITIFLLSLSTCSILAQSTKSEKAIEKADLPDGYYLNDRNKQVTINGIVFREYWSALSKNLEKQLMQKSNGLAKLSPQSSVTVDRYYMYNNIPDEFISDQKGANSSGWINSTPKGSKLGDKCWSLVKLYNDGGSHTKIIILKGRNLCVISILNRKKSKSISSDNIENLIKTIYSRF